MAFREHRGDTERQVDRLQQIFQSLGEKPERKACKGMKGA
jgi:ferritin-like metal-binding protein YciE